jgi:signal transduction histidine kinase
LFSRFFHVDETDNLESRSLGLGLAIVKSIAEKHGGIISVQSQLGEGSTFTLEIPIRND